MKFFLLICLFAAAFATITFTVGSSPADETTAITQTESPNSPAAMTEAGISLPSGVFRSGTCGSDGWVATGWKDSTNPKIKYMIPKPVANTPENLAQRATTAGRICVVFRNDFKQKVSINYKLVSYVTVDKSSEGFYSVGAEYPMFKVEITLVTFVS